MSYPKPTLILFELLAGLRTAFLSFFGAVFAAAILAFVLNVIVVNLFPPVSLEQRIVRHSRHKFNAVIRTVELTPRGEVLLTVETISGARKVTLADVAPVPAESQSLAAWREDTGRKLSRTLVGQPIIAVCRGDPTLAYMPRIYALEPNGDCWNAKFIAGGLLYVPIPTRDDINVRLVELQGTAQRRRAGMYAWLSPREFHTFAGY